MEGRLIKLSRTLAYVLRHHPEEIGLLLDEGGWVSIEELLAALHQRGPWQDVSVDDFSAIIAQSDKKRYEMRDGMIRAYYGHSVGQKMTHESAIPPVVLFHGTTRKVAQAIQSEGLKPMRRQYVHLSADEATAYTVALRKTPRPVILRIDALQAQQQGIKFYDANDQVWLAESIPANFLHFVHEE